jgi:hypothetical protein
MIDATLDRLLASLEEQSRRNDEAQSDKRF